MKYEFKCGESFNSKTIGLSMTVFPLKTRFFFIELKKGYAAMYILVTLKGAKGIGTKFLCAKLFGDSTMPEFITFSGTALPFDLKIVDDYNLAEYAQRFYKSKDTAAVEIDIKYLRDLAG